MSRDLRIRILLITSWSLPFFFLCLYCTTALVEIFHINIVGVSGLWMSFFRRGRKKHLVSERGDSCEAVSKVKRNLFDAGTSAKSKPEIG